jgi:hypothetical protein
MHPYLRQAIAQSHIDDLHQRAARLRIAAQAANVKPRRRLRLPAPMLPVRQSLGLADYPCAHRRAT